MKENIGERNNVSLSPSHTILEKSSTSQDCQDFKAANFCKENSQITEFPKQIPFKIHYKCYYKVFDNTI